MDKLKTVVAVFVVLFAFTAFQVIANYSLRRAVRSDVREQIERARSAEAELVRVQKRIAEMAAQLDAVAARLGELEQRAASVKESGTALEGLLNGLADTVKQIAADLKAAQAKPDAGKARKEGP